MIKNKEPSPFKLQKIRFAIMDNKWGVSVLMWRLLPKSHRCCAPLWPSQCSHMPPAVAASVMLGGASLPSSHSIIFPLLASPVGTQMRCRCDAHPVRAYYHLNVAGHWHWSRCRRHRHSGVHNFTRYWRILIPDWVSLFQFQHRYFFSLRYSTDRMPDGPAFRHSTKIYKERWLS
jgi:hypothetical protein